MKINKKSILKEKELSKIIHQTNDHQEWTNSFQLVRDYSIKSNCDKDIYINVETLQAFDEYQYPNIDNLINGFKKVEPINDIKIISLDGKPFIVIYEDDKTTRGLFYDDYKQFTDLYKKGLQTIDCKLVDNCILMYKDDSIILISVLVRKEKESKEE